MNNLFVLCKSQHETGCYNGIFYTLKIEILYFIKSITGPASCEGCVEPPSVYIAFMSHVTLYKHALVKVKCLSLKLLPEGQPLLFVSLKHSAKSEGWVEPLGKSNTVHTS